MAVDISYIINHPNLTEKYSMDSGEKGRVSFSVRMQANKYQIKQAAEQLFGVKVKKVNTLTQIGKTKRVGRSTGKTSTWKRAVVTFEREVDLNQVMGQEAQN